MYKRQQPSEADPEPQPSTSATQPSKDTGDVGSRKRKRGKKGRAEKVKKTKSGNDDIRQLAGREKLTKEDRQKLYDVVEDRFPGHMAVTRSTLEAYVPGIADENLQYLLMRRNQEAANAMWQRMQEGSSTRQQSILNSLKK